MQVFTKNFFLVYFRFLTSVFQNIRINKRTNLVAGLRIRMYEDQQIQTKTGSRPIKILIQQVRTPY